MILRENFFEAVVAVLAFQIGFYCYLLLLIWRSVFLSILIFFLWWGISASAPTLGFCFKIEMYEGRGDLHFFTVRVLVELHA